MKHLPAIALACYFLVACVSHDTAKIADAVNNHLALYPEATLQDLYKAFFQAEFGAEHIVADTTSAGRYLDSELNIKDNATVLYEPIGADSMFYRVHLRAVQEGYITRNQLFNAFIAGTHQVEIPQIESWKGEWHQISKVIDAMDLNLKDYARESAVIDSLLASDSYAIHHSETFNRTYDPHYRIIRRNIFMTKLMPLLPPAAE